MLDCSAVFFACLPAIRMIYNRIKESHRRTRTADSHIRVNGGVHNSQTNL